MAQGTNPLTTAGDIMSHDGSSAIRVPVGNVGQALQVTGANTLGFGNQKGFQGIDVLGLMCLYMQIQQTILFLAQMVNGLG